MASHLLHALQQDMAERGQRRSDSRRVAEKLGLEPRNSLRQKIENLMWLSLALFILYYGDSKANFMQVAFFDQRVKRTAFSVALMCVGLNTCIFLYLAVWLRHVVRTDEDWNIVAPGAIPAATFLGVVSFALFMYSLWPIFGFLTFPCLYVLFLGFLVVSPYLPPYTKTQPSRRRID
ncbi:hypothetical protein CBR_g6525 [Chara braunii]|uniref:Transmembrane protein 128 n=1 Tax=Chara braunii TaxID=69332 RepID=A0A388KK40_CHABU|nr:hypothetical protein CBR_g6525 [Chara braunii]|eukprot:GBG70397.1 hypothetical protein CBR_g6525 [Chara braunii]